MKRVGRKRTQLLDDLRNRRRYCEAKGGRVETIKWPEKVTNEAFERYRRD